MSNQHDGALRAAILEAIKRPEGMATSKVPGFTVPQIGRMVQKLQTAGLVHRAPTGGKFGRYFDTMQRAQEYADSIKGAPVSGVVIKSQKRWADDLPMVVPENVKIQRVEHAPPRFAPDPQDTSWKVFSSLKYGQYPEAA